MKTRKLKSPLIKGDYIAHEEKWVDMSGAGHYDWCPVWTERTFKGEISYKKIIGDLKRNARREGEHIIGRFPTVSEFKDMGKTYSFVVLSDEDYEDYTSIKPNFFSLDARRGREIIEAAGIDDTVSSSGSSDGYRASTSYRKEVTFEDAIKKLYPEEYKNLVAASEAAKKEFIAKKGIVRTLNYSEYKIKD